EGLPVDELGDDVARSLRLRLVGSGVVENLEDVLVPQLGHRLGLALEPIARLLVVGQVLVEHLDRDDALELAIDAAIHDRHPALPDALEQFVLVEYLAELDHMLTEAMTVMSRRCPREIGPARGPISCLTPQAYARSYGSSNLSTDPAVTRRSHRNPCASARLTVTEPTRIQRHADWQSSVCAA